MNMGIHVEEATEAGLPSVASLISELSDAMDSPPHGGSRPP